MSGRGLGPVCLLAALIGALVSVAWPTASVPMARPEAAVGIYRAQEWSRPTAGRFEWSAAASAKDGWSYDLFTPPAIYQENPGGRFALFSPVGAEKESALAAAGLKLVAVKPEWFRLQVAGHVGAPGGYRAVLVTPEGFETWVAGPGYRFVELGLTVKNIEVLVMNSGAEHGAEVVTSVVLWDEQAGGEVRLDTRERRRTGAWLAWVRPLDDSVPAWALRVGDVRRLRQGICRVEDIQTNPAMVTLTIHDSEQSDARRQTLALQEGSGAALSHL